MLDVRSLPEKRPTCMTLPESFRIRPLRAEDEPFLWECLYLAIHVPPGQPLPSRDVVRHPEVARYLEGWGREHDRGYVAVDAATGQPVGAAWLRLLDEEERGYGFVDAQTPELTIAIVPGFRGHGLGTALLEALLAEARAHYPAISLSVSRTNPAFHLYRRLGFEVVCDCGSPIKMVCRWP